MQLTRSTRYRLAVHTLTLGLLLTAEAHAGLYKCRQPDGRVVYQQTACGGHADAERFEVDIQVPGDTKAGASMKDYSVGAQAAEMRAARQRREEARRQARTQAAASRASAQSYKTPDRAKCAKHRGEVSRWAQKLLQGYEKRSEKDYNESKLAYHEALVERYCP